MVKTVSHGVFVCLQFLVLSYIAIIYAQIWKLNNRNTAANITFK